MDEFIQQLLADSGVTADVDEAVRKQLTEDLTNRATDLVNRRVVESMTPEVFAEFEKLTNQDDVSSQAVQSFIESNVPDRQDIAARALLEFRVLYLGDKA